MSSKNISEKLKSKPVTIKTVLCILSAFIISSSDFSLIKSPFCISLAASLSAYYSAWVMAGSIISYIIFSGKYTFPAVLALFSILLLKFLFRRTDAFINSLITAVSVIISYTVSVILYGFNVNVALAYTYAGILSGIAAYFMTQLFSTQRGAESDIRSNKPAEAVIYFIIISVSSSFSVYGINIGQILSASVVLIYARNYLYYGGATAGVLASTALILSGKSNISDIFILGVAGVAAGTFMNFGRQAAASAFILASLFTGVVTEFSSVKIMFYINLLLGSFIFCFIPVEKFHLEDKKTITSYDSGGELFRVMSFRMRMAASSIDSAITTVNTYNSCCLKKANIKELSGNNMGRQIAEITEREYLDISRNILSDQLKVSSDILKNMSLNITSSYAVDRRITDRIKKCFIENDIGFSSIVAYYNTGGRLFAEIYCSKNSCISGYRIYRVMSDEFGKSFECTKGYDGDEIRFLLSERPLYNIESYIVQKSAKDNQSNGDTCDCFRDDYGHVYLVISDGMGTGDKAAVFSSAASSIFRAFVLGGIDIYQSIYIINSMMITKETDETSATLDVIQFDLDSGNMTVYKSGAAPTIFRHNSSVLSVVSDSYPLGLSGSPVIYSKSFPLKENDTVVMFSDGVTEEVYQTVRRELMSHNDVSDISGNICRFAGKTSNDDVSVIAAKLIRQ